MSPVPVRRKPARSESRTVPTLGRYQNVHPNLQNRFAEHVRAWSRCSRCGLCSARRNVVLFRGTLPCDVLFIGEAPGESEDSIGVPFIGPAGRMLDVLVFNSYGKTPLQDGMTIEGSSSGYVGNARHHISYAITNIVACIPRSPVAIGTGELRTPHKEEAAACQPRLSEILHMASPKLVVCLGDIAKRFFAPLVKAKIGGWQGRTLHLIHPSRILHLQEENPNMASLLEKKFVIALSAALRELGNA